MVDDATHGPLTHMSADAAKAFPDADYVIAVKMPSDATGSPVVKVYASPSFTALSQTNLQSMAVIPKDGTGTEIKLAPGRDEMLKIIHPDATVAYCVNRPTWRWVALNFTKQS